MTFTRWVFLIPPLAAGWIVTPAGAQVLYGSIVGTVTDPSGAVIRNATVSITSTGTGQSRQTLTDEAGRYSIANVVPGNFEVKLSATGFRPLIKTAVEITINTVTRLDVSLEVGSITEALTVTAESARLQTDRGDLHHELDGKAIADLPLPRYRNYQSLIDLVPGATPGLMQNAVTDTPARGLITNINGVNRNNNRTKLDGAANVFIFLNHHALYVPPAETIESANITTNAFDAEQGMAGGAAITVSTKSGTNQFHGSAFAFQDNSKLGAKNFFFQGAATPKSIVNLDGFTLGGPIRRSRIFFFGAWEGLRERASRNGLFTVPNPDQRRGDFSAYPTTLYDPATGSMDGSNRAPFPNNVIPVNRQSAITRRLQEAIPMPNQPGEVAANYFNSASQEFDRENSDIKINFNRNNRHSIWGKYSRMAATVIGRPALGAAGGTCLCDGSSGTGDTLVQLGTIGSSMAFNPRFAWDFAVGYTRMGQVVTGLAFGKGFQPLGIPGTTNSDSRQSGMPGFSISGYTGLGNSGSFNIKSPVFRNDDSYTMSHNLSLSRAAHDLRFGFEVTRHHLNHYQPELGDGSFGGFTFQQETTGLRGRPANLFNAWGSFLLGLPYSLGNASQYIKMTVYEYQWGWYFRDRWQASRKLTISLGIRHELYPLMTRAGYGGIETWDQETNLVRLGGIAGNPKDLGIGTSRKLFAPRIGIAYRLNNSTVIRGGYGINYNPMLLARPLRGFYPLTVTQSLEAVNAYQPVQPIEKGFPDITGPDISQGAAPLPASAQMRTIIGSELHRGYVQSWNITMERKLPYSFVTSAAYVGSQTVRAFADWNANAAAPDTGRDGRPFFPRFELTNDILFWNGYLSADYHSLQTTIRRPFANGLMLQGAYTWSKATNMTDDDGWAGVLFNYLPEFGRNRAQAGYNIPHMLQLAFVYELPFGGRNKTARHRVVATALGGWQINGGLTAVQGKPFTVTASAGTLNAPGNAQTADQVKPGANKIGSLEEFYDNSAFVSPTGTPHFGNTGRNLLRGPGLVNASLSVFRDFTLTERFQLQFRAESFNLTNTPHFNIPDSSVSSGKFMRITSALPDQRTIRGGLRLHF